MKIIYIVVLRVYFTRLSIHVCTIGTYIMSLLVLYCLCMF